ncbi:MAG: acyl carrier protein [Acidobacteria bacterium]|nr:acyl carrier protein [Acidobacteriota bacterium]
MSSAECEIRGYLKSRFPRYNDALTIEAPLDRVVDSLGLFDLVEWLEGRFAIRIPNEEFRPQRFNTIGSIVQTVREFKS